MSGGPLDYLELTRQGLCTVIAKALAHVAENGLESDQHFLMTFRSHHPGVVMPPWLKAQYPDEITIVLQHEYRDLAVMDDRFTVGLSFRERGATLVVPYAAVRTFSDPSVNFGIEIPVSDEPLSVGSDNPIVEAIEAVTEHVEKPSSPSGDDDSQASTVVSLDAFRKK